MFNKVLRWHELGEVENVYMQFNFSQILTYLPKVIKIDKKIDEVLTETTLQSFFRDTVYNNRI